MAEDILDEFRRLQHVVSVQDQKINAMLKVVMMLAQHMGQDYGVDIEFMPDTEYKRGMH